MPKGKEEQYFNFPTSDARGRMFASGGKVEEYKKGGKTKKKKSGVKQPEHKPYEKPALSAKQLEKKRHKGLTKREKELAKKEGLSGPIIPGSGRE